MGKDFFFQDSIPTDRQTVLGANGQIDRKQEKKERKKEGKKKRQKQRLREGKVERKKLTEKK